MSRLEIIIIIIFVAALLWPQASIAQTFAPSHDPAHPVLHWEGQAHHHHDDGTLQVDDSAESAAHVAADPLTANPALPISSSAVSCAAVSQSPPSTTHPPNPAPFLGGLLRPPRPTP